MKKTKLKIGIIDSYNKKSKEYISINNFLRKEISFSVEQIALEEIIRIADLNKKFDVLWWHYDENVDLPETVHDHEIKRVILNFVNNGGGALLSLLASQYIYNLGLEENPPDIIYKGKWEKESWIKDFPDLRGFQGFRNHAIFKNTYNGVYTWNPQKDEDYCEVYHLQNKEKKAGKTVAIGRGYISFNEDLRLINEYKYGKGKILTIGSYFFFSPRSERFQTELKLFTLNCLNYLGNNLGSFENTFWPEEKFELIKLNDKNTKFKIKAQSIKSSKSDLNFSGKGTDNFFDLVGKRTLLMGKENGGINEIWFHPFRAIRDFHFYFENKEGKSIKDNEIRSCYVIQPESIQREYELKKSKIKELLFTSLEKPGLCIYYQIDSKEKFNFSIKFSVDFRYMWPYSENLLNPIKYYWDRGLKCLVIAGYDSEFCINIGTSCDPIKINAEIIPLEKNHSENEEKAQKEICFTLAFAFNKKGNYSIPIVISGSNMGVKESVDTFKSIMSKMQFYYTQRFNYYKKILKNSTILETPDVEFNNGYKWALIGIDKFYCETKPLGTSFFAGFNTSTPGWGNGRPGYAWYFGRDAIWTALAVLKYGDFNKVKNLIQFLGKFQNIDGKIFHELTTSGCLHYDAADSTPLYIILCGYFLKATGDVKFIKLEWMKIKKAIDYCFSTDKDKDHLIENTDVGHGWVEGGYLWPQHSEAYLTVCWAEALKEAAYMSSYLRLKNISSIYLKESIIVKEIFNKKFWNPSSEFYCVGKQHDNTYTNEKTALIAVPLLFNLGDSQKALKTLYEYAGSNFSSDWGARIIREDNKAFKPVGYHYGAVWPLFTGWISLAEYRYFRGVQGFTHLMNNLSIYRFWAKGCIQEALNGEEFLPSGVCPHQAWSESMAIQPALEGMLGINTDVMKNQLSLSPNFPAHWDKVNVKNIRFGKENIDLEFIRARDKYFFKISKKTGSLINLKFMPFMLKYLDINNIKINNKMTMFDIEILDGNLRCILDIKLRKKILIEIDYSGGVMVLPYIPKLHIGAKSRGLRLIKDKFVKNEYHLTLEGKRECNYNLQVLCNGIKIDDIEGGKIISKKDNIYNISVDFEDSKEKYYNKEVILKF